MIKVNPPYLEANDPEKRSTLSHKEKVKLVIEEIDRLYKISKGSNIKLKRTRKNGLLVCSRNEVLQVLDCFYKHHPIKICENIIKICPEDYPYKTIWPSDGGSYNENVEIDPKKPFSIEVLPYFKSWSRIYLSKKNKKISDLESDQIEAVKSLYLDIKKKFNITPRHKVTLIEEKHIKHTTRHDALEYLKGKEIISYELSEYMGNKQKIEVCLDIEEMESFEKENKDFFNTTDKLKENSSSPKKRVDKKDKPATEPAEEKNIFKQNNDYWIINYTGMKDKIEGAKHLKGFLYIRYLLLHPNKKFEALDLDNAIEGYTDPANSGVKLQNEQVGSNSYSSTIRTDLENTPQKKLQMDLADYNDELTSGELTLEGKEEVCEKIRNITNELERRKNPDKEKRQSKIRMAIKRAMSAIAKASKHDNTLFIHLNTHIPIRWPIAYIPEKPISWEP